MGGGGGGGRNLVGQNGAVRKPLGAIGGPLRVHGTIGKSLGDHEGSWGTIWGTIGNLLGDIHER